MPPDMALELLQLPKGVPLVVAKVQMGDDVHVPGILLGDTSARGASRPHGLVDDAPTLDRVADHAPNSVTAVELT
jgi:hypothetical protein